MRSWGLICVNALRLAAASEHTRVLTRRLQEATQAEPATRRARRKISSGLSSSTVYVVSFLVHCPRFGSIQLVAQMLSRQHLQG